MATKGSIADDFLAKLAEYIETSEQMESLGRALEFSTAAINRYTETSRLEGRVTCKGTRDMLFDWRQKVEPCYQHVRLKEALTEAGLVMLADTHLKETEITPDIYSKKISESLTVGHCREKLKNRYLHSFCKIQKAPWDPNDLADFEDLHTVVTMVKKDARGKDTKTKEILRGSVDEILSMKVNGELPVRILVSAPAGRGKTTAVAKIAYDWANREPGSSLENLPLLFVVKLRNTSKQTSIAEAIRSQLLNEIADLTQERLHRFIADNQGICHILLDGLDEYAGIAANQGLGSSIVDVMLWEEFPDCRVLVTTRPHLENFFNQGELPRVYTKMWIEGFSYDSSREYIDKFFASTSNPSNGQDLKIYLDDKPLINELVITPLFCLMVCHLWSEGLLGSDTKTQTDLLDSVNLFLMHHANARSNDKLTEKKLGKIICKLGEVALSGLLNDAKKLVFTPLDFQKVPAILDKACELGIISKKTVISSGLPKASETTSTTVEFYHKLAQEHSAGKNLADQTNKYLLRWKISKMDRVLRKIKENIREYENLIRFAAGTDNRLCIRIMERLLSNRFLDESERYRILLDCSSETSDTEGSVSSMVQRCVTAERMVLKSPTVYTVVGMQNLPDQLKGQIREVKFDDSAVSLEVINGLWSCMGAFTTLCALTISECSLTFPPSSPELPSVTQLKAERVASQSYEGLLSSIPSLKEIDITVGNAENEDISQIQTSLRRHLTGQELTLIRLDEPHSLPSEGSVSSCLRETMRGLGLHISEEPLPMFCEYKEATLLGVVCGSVEERVIDMVQRSTRIMSSSLYSKQFSKSLNSNRNIRSLIIRDCKLTVMITSSMWPCLRSFPSLHSLTISDSSLSFPPSPPELTSVTLLKAEIVTSLSYEGLLSSLPGLNKIDITIDDAERDISQVTAGLHRTGGQQLTDFRIEAPATLQSEKTNVSRETMRGLALLIREHTKNLQTLSVSGLKCIDEDRVDLIESSKILRSLRFQFLGWGSLDYNIQTYAATLGECQLSTDMTIRLWTCLRSFQPSLSSLAISDSSLSFPPSPPELTSVKRLTAKRVTSQSYEGVLSSLPGLEVIDITIDNAESDISQITAGLRRTGEQQLTRINLHASVSLPPQKMTVSRETVRGLGLLIREQTKSLQWLLLSKVKCTDEEDLVYLIECCRHVNAMAEVVLYMCGTQEGGRLKFYLEGLNASGFLPCLLRVDVTHSTACRGEEYRISHIK